MKPNLLCFICKKPIYRIPSRWNGHNVCSYKCRNKYYSGEKSFCKKLSKEQRLNRYGSGNPNWKGGITKKPSICLLCNKTTKPRRKFCDKCVGIAQSIFMKKNNPMNNIISRRKISVKNSGSNNGSWKEGISRLPYGWEFNKKLKNKIKERDQYTCVICEVQKDLVIHHIDYDKKNNETSNLITMCRRCNTILNSNREFNKKHIQTIFQGRLSYDKNN